MSMPMAGAPSALGARHPAAAHRRRRVGATRSGLIQRTRLLNLVLADIYGPQRLCARWPAAAGAPPRKSRFPPLLPRHPPAAGSLPFAARRRSHPRAEWPVVGAQRPHAGAERRRLRARKPHHHLAHLCRRNFGNATSSGLALFSAGAKPACARWRRGQASPNIVSSPPAPTRRLISSMPIWRVTSAIRLSKGVISPCATDASF